MPAAKGDTGRTQDSPCWWKVLFRTFFVGDTGPLLDGLERLASSREGQVGTLCHGGWAPLVFTRVLSPEEKQQQISLCARSHLAPVSQPKEGSARSSRHETPGTRGHSVSTHCHSLHICWSFLELENKEGREKFPISLCLWEKQSLNICGGRIRPHELWGWWGRGDDKRGRMSTGNVIWWELPPHSTAKP